jgi:hypothetical protein
VEKRFSKASGNIEADQFSEVLEDNGLSLALGDTLGEELGLDAAMVARAQSLMFQFEDSALLVDDFTRLRNVVPLWTLGLLWGMLASQTVDTTAAFIEEAVFTDSVTGRNTSLLWAALAFSIILKIGTNSQKQSSGDFTTGFTGSPWGLPSRGIANVGRSSKRKRSAQGPRRRKPGTSGRLERPFRSMIPGVFV